MRFASESGRPVCHVERACLVKSVTDRFRTISLKEAGDITILNPRERL